MNLEVLQADYSNPSHAADIPVLMDCYACDPMGGGEPLTSEVKESLVQALSKLPYAFTVLAYVNDKPAGLVNCFEGFSTFACKPLVNIHDVVVLEEYRGRGISKKMLIKVEDLARSKGCCKLTLEVLSNNHIAKSAYEKLGFDSYSLDPEAGAALFWQKKLAL